MQAGERVGPHRTDLGSLMLNGRGAVSSLCNSCYMSSMSKFHVHLCRSLYHHQPFEISELRDRALRQTWPSLCLQTGSSIPSIM